MNTPGMATHSVSAFNESSAIQFLTQVLEQKHTIKTFFKENDRTPNYDGTLELVAQDGAPTKQFIVQIKKVENLAPKNKGKNKGKYVYSFETKFLYYVKEKVTESPAIFFVVDIAKKNIFWLYLSDTLLMKMEFEGKEKLNYPLTEADKIVDFDEFSKKLNLIAAHRNSLLLQKTPTQVAEMQDALDFINKSLDYDFHIIKESVFPNLWRFGIKYSHNACSIIAGGGPLSAEDTAMFALYPQIRGIPDTGLQEYSVNGHQLFSQWDMTGRTTPMEYVRSILLEILKAFFENGIPIEYLPEIVLQEKLNWFVHSISRFCELEDENGKISIVDLQRTSCLLVNFIRHILFDAVLEENELLLKSEYEKRYIINDCIANIDIFVCSSVAIPEFKKFCATYGDKQVDETDLAMIDSLEKEQQEALNVISELKKRGVLYYSEIWDYDFFTLSTSNPDSIIERINEICKKWFEMLPTVYRQTFDSIFDTKKYQYVARVEYDNKRNGILGPRFYSVFRKYKSNSFQIVHVPNCSDSIDPSDADNGLLSITSRCDLHRFLQRKTPLYDAIHCLLYQGICQELGLDGSSLSIDGVSLDLF